MAETGPQEQKAGKLVPTGFGQPVEWEHFLTSNPKRISAIQNLLDTCQKVFIRTGSTAEPAIRIGFYLGRICLEEFNEILLLAGNGYGFGALKILRNMYERAVTSAYLLQNPDKGDQFNNYHNIHLYRATNHLANLAGLALQLAPEFVAQIKAGYEAVRKDYEEEICKACHKTRVRYSWSPLDTASMARKAGKNYSDLYYSAYYNPTLQTHTTVASVIARLEQNHDDSIGFNRGPQRAEADRAVRLAHDLLLLVVAEQNERFKLGLDAEIHDRAAEFLDVYKHTGKATISADPESKSSGE